MDNTSSHPKPSRGAKIDLDLTGVRGSFGRRHHGHRQRANRRLYNRQAHTPYNDRAKTKTQGSPAAKETHILGTSLQSRFNPLYDLEMQEMDQDQDDQPETTLMLQSAEPLPRIKIKNQDGFNQTSQGVANTYQRLHNQTAFSDQSSQGTRGGARGRHGRGGIPNRTAAEVEHTVVRGSNKGKNIVSAVVYEENRVDNMPLAIGLENVIWNKAVLRIIQFSIR
nr:uncharacterized protein LOC109171840 [Ipomoea batatas]